MRKKKKRVLMGPRWFLPGKTLEIEFWREGNVTNLSRRRQLDQKDRERVGKRCSGLRGARCPPGGDRERRRSKKSLKKRSRFFAGDGKLGRKQGKSDSKLRGGEKEIGLAGRPGGVKDEGRFRFLRELE